MGSGCGSVGRAVASNTRGLWFESSHRPKFIRTKLGGGNSWRKCAFCSECIFHTNKCTSTSFILNICLLSTVYWKDEHIEKEAGDGPFLKNSRLPCFNGHMNHERSSHWTSSRRHIIKVDKAIYLLAQILYSESQGNERFFNFQN